MSFVSTVYDEELIKKSRENAYRYIHGHEIASTNPSFLDALSSTNINLLLDVRFNREVEEDSSIYCNKELGSLSLFIGDFDNMFMKKNEDLEKCTKKGREGK